MRNMWYALYRVNGKSVMKATGVPIWQEGRTEKQTKKEAERQADAMESVARGTSTLESQMNALRAAAAASSGRNTKMPTVAEYLDSFPLTGSEKTVRGKRRTIAVFLGWLGADALKRLDWLSREKMQSFINDQCELVATETVKLLRTHLSTAMNNAVEGGLLTKSPLTGVKIPNLGKDALRRDAMTPQDVKKLLSEAPQTWRDMVILCLNTFGQRLGDIACLRWQAVDFSQNTVTITTQKTKKPMTWPLVPQVRARLLMLYANRCNEFVFPDMARRYQRSAGSLSVEFTALLRMLGIAEDKEPPATEGRRRRVSNKTFHGLRRFAVTDTRKAGVAADLCRELVGHDSEEVERTYFRASMDDKTRTLSGMFGRLGIA